MAETYRTFFDRDNGWGDELLGDPVPDAEMEGGAQ